MIRMAKYLFLFMGVMLLGGCMDEEEVSPVNGTWTAEEETAFFFYEYTFELYQLGDSIAVTDHEVIATFRDPTMISWTFLNGRIDDNRVYLKFRDGSGYVVFDGLLSGSSLTLDKYYGYIYDSEYVEEYRSEVIFRKMN